ncbi:MAG: ATP-binding protein [Candidatus Aminicenantes bacterium]|nr:ATP-binding protein [Candidatus Aminicenantes bacterium]
MTDSTKSFEERLYTEYNLSGRVRLIIILSGILYPAFLILDSIYAAQFFKLFLSIRLVVLAAHVVLFYLCTRIKVNRNFVNVAIVLTIFDVAGISVMIYFLGGFATAYVQGLYIIIMGLAVAVPLSFRVNIRLYAMVWASYAIPSFLNMTKGRWQDVFNNLFFLTSLIIIGSFGSFIMENIRRRELQSRIQLEEITEKLRFSNEKLKSLDELKTQFFANINHELRTPLSLILAPLKSIMEGKMGQVTSSTKDTMETMQRNGFRLLKLINNLLDLSKFEGGKMRLKIQSVNISDFINDLLQSVRDMADHKKIQMFYQHPPYNVELTVDPDQFEKVVLNLLSNALKFTPEKGKITMLLEEKDKTVSLAVEDTGIGIPPDMLESIFDRFSQVDGSASRSQPGTGIGLSLAKEIVLLHGGTISAESQMGKGTRFIVEMPKGDAHFSDDVIDRRVKDEPVEFKKRATDSDELKVQDVVTDFRRLNFVDLEKVEIGDEDTRDGASHDALLLVVDDNPEILRLMKMLLSDEFDLMLCSSAKEGLSILKQELPDLVLCDVQMPEMDGFTFAKKIKSDESTKHIPIIMVTARAGGDMVSEGIKAGADDYISKPFESIELKARINNLLRLREMEAEIALANRNLSKRASDLVERQHSLYLSTVKSLASAIDAKDEYTRHHSTRVTEYTLKIAKNMEFRGRELEDLELAALLHDIGKIAVPEHILNKPGKLTDEEFASIKEHPVRGQLILEPVKELKEVGKVVRSHHEKYDGTGYPDGLKGTEIPLGSRIMMIADTFDSITSDRPYRRATSPRRAVKEIIRCSGTQFDPEIVEHFLEVYQTFKPNQEKAPLPEKDQPDS